MYKAALDEDPLSKTERHFRLIFEKGNQRFDRNSSEAENAVLGQLANWLFDILKQVTSTGLRENVTPLANALWTRLVFFKFKLEQLK